MKLNTEPNPRLQAAITEMVAIAEKYDVAVVIAACTEEQLEYVIHASASWNCMGISDGAIRLNSTDLPEAEKQPKVANTIGAIMGFQHISKFFYDGFSEAANMLSQHFDISHVMKRLQ